MNCIFTVLTSDFFMGFETFIKSLLAHNKWFNFDFVIVDVNLNEGMKERAIELYKNIKFIKPIYENYKFDRVWTPEKFKNCDYIYELFRLREYDKIVAFDMDMLICGDISELFKIERPYSMCRCYRAKTDKMMDIFNSGLLVVNNEMINNKVYKDLLKIASRPNRGGDQDIFNKYFRGRINEIPKKYNVEKRMFYSQKFKKKLGRDIICLHYVGVKPWQLRLKSENRFEEWEYIWWTWYSKGKICVRNAKMAKIGLIQMLSWVWQVRKLKPLNDMDMIEIGSYAGDSTEIFAQHFREVFAIDPYLNGYDKNDDSSNNTESAEKEYNNKRKIFYRMEKIKDTSLHVAEKCKMKFDIIYIDGLHIYKGCKQDIQAWLPKIKKGGFISGHDYQDRFKGVKQAVNECIGKPDMVFADTSWIKQI